MKGEELVASFRLGFQVVAWIILMAVVAFSTARAKSPVRFICMALAILSLPAYIYLSSLYRRHQFEMNVEQRSFNAVKSSQQFKRLCEIAPAIQIRKVVRGVEPVDIRVIEAQELFGGLEILVPRFPEKSICWLVSNFSSCKPSNIGRVEWKLPNSPFCQGSNPSKDCKTQYFRNDRRGSPRNPIGGFFARYALSVSEPEKLDVLIDKFTVSLRDTETGEVLAETFVIQKSRYGMAYEKSALEENEPRHCPVRDVHIADMLSQVFPLTDNLLPEHSGLQANPAVHTDAAR